MPWYKVWPLDLITTNEWHQLSDLEKLVLRVAFDVLAIARSRGKQALTSDVARYTGKHQKTVDKCFQKLVEVGYISQQSSNFSSTLFELFQEPKDKNSAARSHKYRESRRDVTRDATAPSRVYTEAEADVIKTETNVSAKSRPTERPPARDKKLPTTRKLETTDYPEVTFGPDDETLVAAMLATVASNNENGKLQVGRIKRLRQQMRFDLDEFGPVRWRHGMQVALSKPDLSGNPTAYARSVMKNCTEDELAAPKRLSRSNLVAFPGGLSEKPLHSAKANERFVKIQEELEAKSRERIAEIEKRLAKDLPPTADQSQ